MFKKFLFYIICLAPWFLSSIIPVDFDYDRVTGLSFEVRQKLKTHRPETLGQAGRISGVTPAAISLLLIYMRGRKILNK